MKKKYTLTSEHRAQLKPWPANYCTCAALTRTRDLFSLLASAFGGFVKSKFPRGGVVLLTKFLVVAPVVVEASNDNTPHECAADIKVWYDRKTAYHILHTRKWDMYGADDTDRQIGNFAWFAVFSQGFKSAEVERRRAEIRATHI